MTQPHQGSPLGRKVPVEELERHPVAHAEPERRVSEQPFRTQEVEKDSVAITEVLERPLLVRRCLGIHVPPAGVDQEATVAVAFSLVVRAHARILAGPRSHTSAEHRG